ncbi:MAG TPA: ABC transporter permease subunit [archaeon]|nr:ABC transporter permease subunit [archaeon]
MTGTIIYKELLDHLQSLRFMVGFVLCVILTVSCVIILTHDYSQEMRDYSIRLSMNDDFLEHYAHTNRVRGVLRAYKPPEEFRPFVIGVPRDADLGSFDDNPLPAIFPPLDLLFIVTIIMSLLAILFSYDAVAGERESGTLKLMVSNSLSKAKILLGKWIGGTVSLVIPFLFSILAGGLYITIHPNVKWDSAAWASFFLLILASVTFISLFYLLGILVSASSRFSSTSILTSLFLWVLLVLVLPNLSPYVAAQLYRIPSVNKVEREAMRLTNIERDNLGRKLSKEVNERYEQQYGQIFTEYQSLSKDEVRRRVAADPGFKAMHEAYRKEFYQAWDEANRIQREKADKLRSELVTKADRQNKIAKTLACISPYADFVYVATDLSGTGLRSLSYFKRVSGEYSGLINKYLSKKSEEAAQKDPTFNENTFLDVSDRPRFSYKEEPLKDRLEGVLPYWGILIFFNVVFFAGAFVKFIRYDVR